MTANGCQPNAYCFANEAEAATSNKSNRQIILQRHDKHPRPANSCHTALSRLFPILSSAQFSPEVDFVSVHFQSDQLPNLLRVSVSRLQGFSRFRCVVLRQANPVSVLVDSVSLSWLHRPAA